MRVFVPMNDEWFTDPRFAKEALVPYRCGVRLLPQLLARRDDEGSTIWEMSAPREATA